MSDIRLYPRALIENFITLYRGEECLWNHKCRNYLNRQRRKKSYDKLIKFWRMAEPDADKNCVLRKINSLRTSWRRERKKKANSDRSWREYTPKLWYYDMLSFLDDPLEFEPMEEIETLEEIDRPYPEDDEDEEDVDDPSSDSQPETTESNKSKEDESQSADTSSKLLEKLDMIPPDEVSPIYAEYVIAQLRNATKRQRIFAERLISEVLFLCRMNKLSEFHTISYAYDKTKSSKSQSETINTVVTNEKTKNKAQSTQGTINIVGNNEVTKNKVHWNEDTINKVGKNKETSNKIGETQEINSESEEDEETNDKLGRNRGKNNKVGRDKEKNDKLGINEETNDKDDDATPSTSTNAQSPKKNQNIQGRFKSISILKRKRTPENEEEPMPEKNSSSILAQKKVFLKPPEGSKEYFKLGEKYVKLLKGTDGEKYIMINGQPINLKSFQYKRSTESHNYEIVKANVALSVQSKPAVSKMAHLNVKQSLSLPNLGSTPEEDQITIKDEPILVNKDPLEGAGN